MMRSYILAGLAVAVLAFPIAGPASARGGIHIHRGGGFHGGGIHRGFGGVRHGYGGVRGGFARRGFHGGYYGARRFGGRRIGAGLAGLAAGAIIGGTIAATEGAYAAPYRGNAVAYCESRFKSYNPSSGTYLGYDGLRHPCP